LVAAEVRLVIEFRMGPWYVAYLWKLS